MPTELSTTTYLVPEPFEPAVRSLRKVLSDANLELAGELDMSSRIRTRLLIGIAPCRVMFVAATPAELVELGADPRAAALMPLHVVASARGSQTEIHLLRALPGQNGPLDGQSMDVIRQLQTRIAQAVERIAMRSGFAA